MMGIKINFGCGRTPTEGWINVDNSPALKLAASPIMYRVSRALKLLNAKQIENIEWNKRHDVTFADATSILPFEDASVDVIYSSHMLEHLPQDGAKNFLSESYRILRAGGMIRIAVPDLKLAVEEYAQHGDADRFMKGILVSAPPVDSLRQKLHLLWSGYRHHQWMYDGSSLCKLLAVQGFSNAEIVAAGKTNIDDPDSLDLYERSEQSVYVEAMK